MAAKKYDALWARWGGDRIEHLWRFGGKRWRTACGEHWMLMKPLGLKSDLRCTACILSEQ